MLGAERVAEIRIRCLEVAKAQSVPPTSMETLVRRAQQLESYVLSRVRPGSDTIPDLEKELAA